MRPTIEKDVLSFTVAMFPYLKTSGPVRIGPYMFRSTDDTSHLPPSEAKAVTEISEMLFVQNHARVRSASYTIVERLELDRAHLLPEAIQRVQAFVAYLYASPHESFGDTFLPFECATLLLMTPDSVSRFLVDAQHHVIDTTSSHTNETTTNLLDGYSGLLNFRQHLWAAKNSRIYPPLPNITLNISQNLANDCQPGFSDASVWPELLELLEQEESQVADRIFTAIDWYNATNRREAGDSEALMSLAIAFEALLQLPNGETTDRFVDSVSLLLGRVPRLTEWTRQFYDARSRIAHEGKLSQSRFRIKRGSGKGEQDLIYHPLLLFGRHVFRLCLAAISHGAYLAKSGDLAAKLTTNCERFEGLCRLFKAGSLKNVANFRDIRGTVMEIERYRFVYESGITVALVVGATQRGAKSLLDCQTPLVRLTPTALTNLAEAKVSRNELAALTALEKAHLTLSHRSRELPSNEEQIICQLIDIAWHYTFQRYFHLKHDANPI